MGAGGKCGEMASSTGNMRRLTPRGAHGGSEIGTLTGEREEAVEGAAAQLILV